MLYGVLKFGRSAVKCSGKDAEENRAHGVKNAWNAHKKFFTVPSNLLTSTHLCQRKAIRNIIWGNKSRYHFTPVAWVRPLLIHVRAETCWHLWIVFMDNNLKKCKFWFVLCIRFPARAQTSLFVTHWKTGSISRGPFVFPSQYKIAFVFSKHNGNLLVTKSQRRSYCNICS